MILEGLVTTLGPAGQVNLAPMGPRLFPPFVLAAGVSFELQPFETSRTCANLRQHLEGVLHVTDDVLLIARAALDSVDPVPELVPALRVQGRYLTGACRAYEFRIHEIDDSAPRLRMRAEVVHVHLLREFFGFNRAMHAVLEAAILATRLHLIPGETIRGDFERLEVLVRKTGGPREVEAFAWLESQVYPRLDK